MRVCGSDLVRRTRIVVLTILKPDRPFVFEVQSFVRQGGDGGVGGTSVCRHHVERGEVCVWPNLGQFNVAVTDLECLRVQDTGRPLGVTENL